MDRSVWSYVRALCDLLENARDCSTVKSILRHALQIFLDAKTPLPAELPQNLEQQDTLQCLLVEITTQFGSNRERLRNCFFSTYCAPYGAWPETLLSVVASDWLDNKDELSDSDRTDLLYPFFLAAPISVVVPFLVNYLSMLRNVNPGGHAQALPAGGDFGMEILRVILTENGSLMLWEGLKRSTLEVDGESGWDGDELAGKIVSIPDVVAGLGDPIQSLNSNNFVQAVVGNLLDHIQQSLNNDAEVEKPLVGEIKDKRKVDVLENLNGVEHEGSNVGTERMDVAGKCIGFVSALIGRFVKRGFAGLVAKTVIQHAVKHNFHSQDCKTTPQFAVVVAGVQDLAAKEKLLEAFLSTLCRPANVWSDQHALQFLSRWFEYECSAPVSSMGRDLQYIIGGKFLLKKTLPYPALSWLVELLHEHDSEGLMHCTMQLVRVWSDVDVLTQMAVPLQAYLTTALLLIMEKLRQNGGKEHEIGNGEITSLVFSGITERLGSPLSIVRHQGMRVARRFSELWNTPQPLFETIKTDYFQLTNEEMWEGAELRSPEVTEELHIDLGNDQQQNGEISVRSVDRGGGGGGVKGDAESVIDSDDDSSYVSSSDDESFKPMDLSEGDDSTPMLGDRCLTLHDAITMLRKTDDPKSVLEAVKKLPVLLAAKPDELESVSGTLAHGLVHAFVPDWDDNGDNVRGNEVMEASDVDGQSGDNLKLAAMVGLLTTVPRTAGPGFIKEVYSSKLTIHQRILIMDSLCEAAKLLSSGNANSGLLDTPESNLKDSGEVKRIGTTRVWGVRSLAQKKKGKERVWRNEFLDVAQDWMAGLLKECDTVKLGVDLFGRDHLVLGKLLITLGKFAECASQTTLSSRLASATLEVIKAPAVSQHKEPYIRRCALVAASHTLAGLPPAAVAGAMLGPDRGDAMDRMLGEKLEWLMSWGSQVARLDKDETCRLLAAGCVAKQMEIADRALECLANTPGGLEAPGLKYKLPSVNVL